MPNGGFQRERAREFLREHGIVRPSELARSGVTGATLARMVDDGEVVRLARGLYQLPDAPLEFHHTMAEAAKRVPRGVVCLVSALSYHDLTDQLPRAVWMAVGYRDWATRLDWPPVRIVRFADRFLEEDVRVAEIEGVPVRVFGVAKTVADCFRHRNKIGQDIALEGMREALRQRKATPAEIARRVRAGGVWTVARPYLEALVADG